MRGAADPDVRGVVSRLIEILGKLPELPKSSQGAITNAQEGVLCRAEQACFKYIS